jgi:hypothetical protein
MVEVLAEVHRPDRGDTKVDWDANVPVQYASKGVEHIHNHHPEVVRVRVQKDHLVHRAYDALPKACQRYSRKPHFSMLPRVQVWY